MQESTHMHTIHRPLLVPREGMIAIGNMRATMMPLIMMVLMLLNTASTPLCAVLRVERGTIRLWLML